MRLRPEIRCDQQTQLTWREQEYARRSFDGRDLNRLEIALERIASGAEDGGKVVNVARQIVADLPTT